MCLKVGSQPEGKTEVRMVGILGLKAEAACPELPISLSRWLGM